MKLSSVHPSRHSADGCLLQLRVCCYVPGNTMHGGGHRAPSFSGGQNPTPALGLRWQHSLYPLALFGNPYTVFVAPKSYT